MKATKLVIKNIGRIADETIEINKPLILFYGEIRQGKTTILNAVRWVVGGEFPSDIIRHGQTSASVELHLDRGLIIRSWYLAEDKKTVKARPVQFILNGKPVASPVGAIKQFLNPFLLDQDHFRNMNELERKRYLSELFAVDTNDIDADLSRAMTEASNLRIEIKSYGTIDVTPFESVDIAALKARLAKVNADHQAEYEAVSSRNQEALAHNLNIRARLVERDSVQNQIAGLKKELEEAEAKLLSLNDHLKKMSPRQTEDFPAMPAERAELETQIEQAAAQNEKAKVYEVNQTRRAERAAKEKKLTELEALAKALREKKLNRLKDISTKCKIPGLTFTDAGEFIYQQTQAGMLSTSQLMELSNALSALYPEGFGLDLIDRGESLGKSIFEFVDRAKAEKKTILATIVGEKPAKAPPEVGVFVVDNGHIKP